MIRISAQCETPEESQVMAGLVHLLPPGVSYEVWLGAFRVMAAGESQPVPQPAPRRRRFRRDGPDLGPPGIPEWPGI